MSRYQMLSLWMFYGFLSQSVCFVPSPTNLSVVCHNFVNVLYWNYSKPTEQLKFLVTIKPYSGFSQALDTSQTYLNISDYSSDADDDYFVTVRAHDGREESKNISIKFTYSTTVVDKNEHECSVDFPPVNTVVHKDVINVSFPHPYSIYNNEILSDFTYKVTHDQRETEYECLEDEELCTAEIHFPQSLVGKCIELKFEGVIEVLFTTTYKNVCLSEIPDVPVHNLRYIALLVAGGVVILLICVGFVWLLCKKWSKIPKIPEALLSFMNVKQSATPIHQRMESPVSLVTSACHSPLLEPEDPEAFNSPTVSPPEKDTTTTPTDIEEETVPDTSEISEVDAFFEESGNYGRSSDYDSPKFLQEMSPGDFATGYGPRPPVL